MHTICLAFRYVSAMRELGDAEVHAYFVASLQRTSDILSSSCDLREMQRIRDLVSNVCAPLLSINELPGVMSRSSCNV